MKMNLFYVWELSNERFNITISKCYRKMLQKIIYINGGRAVPGPMVIEPLNVEDQVEQLAEHVVAEQVTE